MDVAATLTNDRLLFACPSCKTPYSWSAARLPSAQEQAIFAVSCDNCGGAFSVRNPLAIADASRPVVAASASTELGTAKTFVAAPSTPPQSSLATRYTDAYLVARTINGLGEGIKIAGFALGGLIVLAGFAAASKIGGAFGFGAILLGAVVALPIYVLGVLVSAQGQILKATLDTAVNSSPLLSHDEVRQILTH